MWHLAALAETTTTATLTDLNPVPDSIMLINNNHFIPPDDLDLYFAVCYGTNLQRVRFTTPKIRMVSPVYLRPTQPTLIGANDPNVAWMAEMPLRLARSEELVVESLQNAGADQLITVLLALGRERRPIPPGDCYTIRASSTTALVANTWTLLSYTMESVLPAGRYAMIGSEVISTNGQGHRWTFDNQFYRPGFPSLATVAMRLPYPMYGSQMGVMGYFDTVTLPRLEALGNSTDNAHEIYMRVVKIG